MDEIVNIGVREMACPGCGYDLRATGVVEGGRRCPECGRVWRGGVWSRVPWAYWRSRGAVGAYLGTVWMVVMRPGRVARELGVAGRMREARQFYWVTVVLMTVVGTGLMELGILNGLDPLFVGREAARRLIFWNTDSLPDGSEAFATASVALDRWYEIVPLAIGMYGAVRAGLWMYERMWMWGLRGWRQRRRAARVAKYLSAVWLVEMVLLGIVWSAGWWEKRAEDFAKLLKWHWDVEYMVFVVLLLAAGSAVGVYLIVTLGFGLKARPRWRVLTALAFPAVALVVGELILLGVHGVVGYVILAWQSMGT